jgi:predicted nucleotidyltransferase component of viral defense system
MKNQQEEIPYYEVYQAFNKAGINYAVCGGAAVILLGYARMSVDLDLVVELNKVNLEKVYDSMIALGYRPSAPITRADFCDLKKIKQLEVEKNMKAVSFYSSNDPFAVVDIGVNLPLIDEILKNKKSVKIGRLAIPIIWIDDLIKMKEDLARPKDLMDVAHLKEIKKNGKTNN